MAGLWMVRDTQNIDPYFGNPVINIYGYKSNLTVINEENELLNSFVAHIIPAAIAIQNVQTYHVQVEAIELNGTRYASQTLTASNNGLRTGNKETNFIAWGFRLNRAALAVRSGAKRIGLVSDTDVSNGSPASGMATLLAAFATAYGDALQFGLIDTWFPVILERPDPPSTVWASHDSSGASFTNVTSQNSRKK